MAFCDCHPVLLSRSLLRLVGPHANEVLPRSRRTRDHGLSIKDTALPGHISASAVSLTLSRLPFSAPPDPSSLAANQRSLGQTSRLSLAASRSSFCVPSPARSCQPRAAPSDRGLMYAATVIRRKRLAGGEGAGAINRENAGWISGEHRCARRKVDLDVGERPVRRWRRFREELQGEFVFYGYGDEAASSLEKRIVRICAGSWKYSSYSVV